MEDAVIGDGRGKIAKVAKVAMVKEMRKPALALTLPEMAQNLPKLAQNSQYWQSKAVTYKVILGI